MKLQLKITHDEELLIEFLKYELCKMNLQMIYK